MSKLSILLVGLITILLTACTSESSPPASEPSAEYIEAAKHAVWLAKLTLADLPPGWTVDYDSDEDDEDVDDFFSGECEYINEEYLPGQIAVFESDEFDGPGDQSASTQASALPTTESASGAMELVRTVSDECWSQLRQGFSDAMRKALSEDGTVSSAELDTQQTQVEVLQLPSIPGSVVIRLTWSIVVREKTIGSTIDSIVWQEDRLVVQFDYSTFTGDMGDREEIDLVFADRVQKAAETLPD